MRSTIPNLVWTIKVEKRTERSSLLHTARYFSYISFFSLLFSSLHVSVFFVVVGVVVVVFRAGMPGLHVGTVLFKRSTTHERAHRERDEVSGLVSTIFILLFFFKRR